MKMTQLEHDLEQVFRKHEVGAAAIIVLSPDGEGAKACSVSATTAENLTTLYHLTQEQFFGAFAPLNGLPHYAALGAMHSLTDMAHESYEEQLEKKKAMMEAQLDDELDGLGRKPPKAEA